MSNEQIFYQAMKKAFENGYKGWGVNSFDNTFHPHVYEKASQGEWISTIFSHDFAKAFWKKPDDWDEGHIVCDFIHPEGQKCAFEYDWEDYLKIMVLHEEPLRYLEQFLPNPKGLTV